MKKRRERYLEVYGNLPRSWFLFVPIVRLDATDFEYDFGWRMGPERVVNLLDD